MIGFFERHTALQFDGDPGIPDTYGQLDGAGRGGRRVRGAGIDSCDQLIETRRLA